MKIAVVGAGAMGLLFGGRLAMAGHQVTMIDVAPEVLNSINQKQVTLIDDEGEHRIPLPAMRGEELCEEQELVILFTKTLYSRSALQSAAGYIGAQTGVLTLQNGLGNVELVNEFVDLGQILVGVTNYASDVLAPGTVRTQGSGYVRLMTANAQLTPFLSRVRDALAGAGFSTEIREDVFSAIWEKVGFNAALNSTTALCRAPVGALGSCEEGREVAYAIAREAAQVAKAHGVEVDAESIIASINFAFAHHQDHYTSMAQDIQKQRRTEIDFINGGIISRAEEKGIPVPCTRMVYQLMKVVEASWNWKTEENPQ